MRMIFKTNIALLAVMLFAVGCAEQYGPPPRAEITWVNGKPEGPVVIYDAWGRVMSRGTFHQGLKEGTWTHYVSTGLKVVELSYREGLKDGLCRMWYGPFNDRGRYTGNLKLEITFRKGLPVEKRQWYPGGEKGAEMEFEYGRVVRARVWRESGEELPPSQAMAAAEEGWRVDQTLFAGMDQTVEEGLRNSGGAPSAP
jgi:antitoxin component YwqK of YwqJK toxin-antitoxin module